MRAWESASVIFFLYVAAAAAVPGRPRPRALLQLYTGVAAGVLFVYGVSQLPYYAPLHDWVAPPVTLLLGYWVSGLLFVAPKPGQERVLMAFDRRLRILETARRMPRLLVWLLEAAYLGVYPVIPLALIVHLWLTPAADAERFWSVILITDFICFGMLAWVQTRPPRALESGEPWDTPLRRINVRMLGAASIQVNTFPSGHAAEGLAAALLVSGAPWPLVLGFFVIAVGIAAGAVYGRYHYAADALAGWAVALVVFGGRS